MKVTINVWFVGSANTGSRAIDTIANNIGCSWASSTDSSAILELSESDIEWAEQELNTDDRVDSYRINRQGAF